MDVLRNFHKFKNGANPFPNMAPKGDAATYTCDKLDSISFMGNLWRHLYHGNYWDVRCKIVSVAPLVMVYDPTYDD